MSKIIIDRPQSHFIFIFSTDSVRNDKKYIAYQGKPLTNKEYLEHWGKWVIMGSREELDELAKKLDPYVETGDIPCIKYDRTRLNQLGFQEHVMCVYCDNRNREEVWKILAGEGVKIKAWFYERETIEMWSPGGRLLENWIASHNLSPKEADEIREDARKKMTALFENENEIFTGLEQ